MPDILTWDDADEIGILLGERFPDTDPEVVSDLEITRWVREIPTLNNPEPPPHPLRAQLSAIRAAWTRNRRAA